MALALDEPKESDTTYQADGITYMIDKELSARIGTVKVDYTESGWRSGFTVSSEKPISTGPSTCGSSCSC